MKADNLIRINRPAAPNILATSKGRNRYRHPIVVQVLFNMQHGKCCYCEGHLPDTGPEKQVEHFRPQSKCPTLRHSWHNLLLACATCNWEKRDTFPTTQSGDPVLLDPSDPKVDPEEHIAFLTVVPQGQESLRGLPIPRNGSLRGKETINSISLASEHHMRRRAKTIHLLERCYRELLYEINKASSGHGHCRRLQEIRCSLQSQLHAAHDYAGVSRSYCQARQLHRLGVSTPP